MTALQRVGRADHSLLACAELRAVIQEQERLTLRLLELSASDRVSLLEGRVEELESSTREKAAVTQRMELLERQRREAARRLAQELRLPEDASLADLATAMGGQEGSELAALRGRVAGAVARLKDSNEANLVLMRKSLDLVRDSIRQFRRNFGSGEAYTNTGQPTTVGGSNLVVDRLA